MHPTRDTNTFINPNRAGGQVMPGVRSLRNKQSEVFRVGAALFPEFEKELPGIDAASVGGKALSRAEPELHEIASRIGVTPLMEFYGADDVAVAGEVLDGEIFEASELEESSARWFDAGEGLRAVGGLLQYLGGHSDEVADVGAVVADLREMQRVLAEAEKAGVRWHMAVDF